MDILAILTGISPWWWIAFAILLFVVEMLTFTYFVIWIAAAAAAMGLILFVAPDLSGIAQLALFAILSVTITVAGRFAMARMAPDSSGGNGALNQRAARLIGRSGQARGTFDGVEGQVEVDQIIWRARLAEPATVPDGTRLTVTGAEDMTLICKPS